MPETNPADAEAKKLTTGQKWFLGFLVLAFLGWLFGGADYEIEGGVAKISSKVRVSDSLSYAASEVLGDTYEVVHDNSDIKRIELTLYMSKMDVSDKYGNELEEDIKMGTIAWDREDIEEILKFKKDYMFKQNDIYKAVVMVQIKRMGGDICLMNNSG